MTLWEARVTPELLKLKEECRMNRETVTEIIGDGEETMIWYSLVHDGRECRDEDEER